MSAQLATASPHRIKAAHRRRRSIVSGHRPYANNNPYRFKDPDGRQSYGYGTNQPDQIKDCNQTGTCKTLAQTDAMLKKDAEHVAVAVAAPAVIGGAGGLAVATGAPAAASTAVSNFSNGLLQSTVSLGITAQAALNATTNTISNAASRVSQFANVAADKSTAAFDSIKTSSGFEKAAELGHKAMEFFEGYALPGPPAPTPAGYVGFILSNPPIKPNIDDGAN